MAVSDNVPPSWTVTTTVALIAIVTAPPCLCVWLWRTGWQGLAAGALLWAVAVAGKGLLFSGLNLRGYSPPVAAKAALLGALSAGFELGAAAFYLFHAAPAPLAQVASFGIGAGCAEAAYVLGVGVFGPKATPARLAAWIAGASKSLCVRYSVPIERFFALVGHTGSRGLIYVGLHAATAATGAIWIAIAFLLFSLIDGVAVYGHLSGWDWSAPTVCRRSHLLFSLTAMTEAALFVLAFR
jgi:hypothetical protein